MVGNYYKPGPATIPGEVSHRSPTPRRVTRQTWILASWFVADNFMLGNPAVTRDNWNGGVQPQHGDMHISVLKLDEPWPAMPIHEQSAEEAYRDVLRDAGATLPKRDVLDRRIVEETRRGEATLRRHGIQGESSRN